MTIEGHHMATGGRYKKTLKVRNDPELLEQVMDETKGSTQAYQPTSGGASEPGCISRT
ncbi:MAG: hypothetical protein V3U09_03735 [Thermoplasmata archaeon]